MHIARFLWSDRVRRGVVEGDEVRALNGETMVDGSSKNITKTDRLKFCPTFL